MRFIDINLVINISKLVNKGYGIFEIYKIVSKNVNDLVTEWICGSREATVGLFKKDELSKMNR